MKKIPFIILFAGGWNGYVLAERFECPLTDTVYFGYTTDHTKAVELCRLKDKNKNIKYKYTFGAKGAEEIVIVKEKPLINFNGSKYGGFQVENGIFTYNVVNGKNDNSTLFIEKDDIVIAKIPIDTADSSFITHTFSIMMD